MKFYTQVFHKVLLDPHKIIHSLDYISNKPGNNLGFLLMDGLSFSFHILLGWIFIWLIK